MTVPPGFRTLPLLALAGFACTTPLGAQVSAQAPDAHTGERPRVRAVALAAPIAVDGRLDDAAWADAAAATGFTQQDPHEGQPATQRTEVRFAYDEEALYIAARMFDELGAEGIRTRLGRRDSGVQGDYIEIIFDTYHDHSGRTIFRINPSGVKGDAGQGTSYADPSWDPVWEAATRVDSLGWTAELRIPFSQLRFPRDSVQTWGLQVWRYAERLNESSMWSFWGKQEAGGPQRFGHLEEVGAPDRSRSVELLPYSVARASFVRPSQPGSPFEEPRDYAWRFGGDVKALLTSTLTLDATINPDFGQVEVDPAVVNLSAFETFFEEKRPFFIEGSGLFGFGGFNCYFCSNVSSMSLFYSRRIGRTPQGSVDDAEYVDIPENTTILGAAKVTGRTAGGYQIGLLNAVTGAELASAMDDQGRRFEEEVEPLTNYFVGRVRRTFRGGNATLGAMATSVNRRFENDALRDLLPGHAETLGVDWRLSWNEQTYSLMGNLALSQVGGEPDAILRLQRASARYFHRPDRGHGGKSFFSDRYDSTLTSLRGYGGYLRLAKDAGDWLWEGAVNYRSPGFEANDLAFLTRADYVWMNGNIFRQWTKPTAWYRQANLLAGAQQQYNFDGDLTDRQLHVFGWMQLPNYWSTSSFYILRPEVYEDRLTRGGPVVRRARNWTAFANLRTDSRKRVVLGTNPSYGRNTEGSHGYSVNLDVRFKPASNIEVSVGPSFDRSGSSAQFVERFDDPTADHFHGQRIVFADLVQHSLSMNTRLTATFSPTLTLEVFAQPFVASGEYSGFKEFDAPRAISKTAYDAAQLGVVRSAAGRDSLYILDPDRDPATGNFNFSNPDFNFRSLRGNAVLRWEWRPGSTLYLVWQQQRAGDEPFGDFRFSRDVGAIFNARPDNIFVAKLSYWFGS